MINLLKDIEWRRHLPGLVLFSVAFIFFVVTCFFYFDELGVLRDDLGRFRQQQSVNMSADESRRLLNDYLPQYELEKARGLIGPARRLQWVESAQNLSEIYQIPLIEYTLDGAESVDELNNVYWHPELSLLNTPMTLDLDLRHEGDFLRIMNGLLLDAEGLFSIEECVLGRNSVGEGEDPLRAGLKGRCSLIWYSIADITESWERDQR
jgi:hypothetical protein